MGMFGPKGHIARKFPDLPPKAVEDLRRVVFFQSSYVFAARPIPGLESLPEGGVALVGGGDGSPVSDEGDAVTLTSMTAYSTPAEMKAECPPAAATGGQRAAPQADPGGTAGATAAMGELSVDARCNDCVFTFVDNNALVAHCRETGHFPVTSAGAPGAQAVRPANKVKTQPNASCLGILNSNVCFTLLI